MKKTDVFCQFITFLDETTLRKWDPWQQRKVYTQKFEFEMLSINIGEKSQSFKQISFMGLELLRKKFGGG